MVAQAASQSKSALRGIRPFDPRTDLVPVARLLEEAFRSEHGFPLSNLPLLRQVGIVLWTLNYTPTFPESTSGFVWVEDGQVVGNVTLSLDQGKSERYYLSNVAVKPEYRRQGIARALVQSAIDHIRAEHAKKVLLNVRPNNPDAIKLYEDLGFRALEMRGEWSLPPLPPPASPLPSAMGREGIELGAWREVDPRAVSDLIRAGTPAQVQPYHPRRNDFELHWDERIFETLVDLFTFQSTQRWSVKRNGRLAAVVMVRGQYLFSPHRIALQTHPDFRGQVEDDLIEIALQRLAHFPPRQVRVEASAAYPELIAALERHEFKFLSGLTLMELEL